MHSLGQKTERHVRGVQPDSVAGGAWGAQQGPSRDTFSKEVSKFFSKTIDSSVTRREWRAPLGTAQIGQGIRQGKNGLAL